MEDFNDYNFLIFNNLKDDGHLHGQLCLKLEFETELSEKLFAIFIPIWEKQLIFDRYANVTLQ